MVSLKYFICHIVIIRDLSVVSSDLMPSQILLTVIVGKKL